MSGDRQILTYQRKETQTETSRQFICCRQIPVTLNLVTAGSSNCTKMNNTVPFVLVAQSGAWRELMPPTRPSQSSTFNSIQSISLLVCPLIFILVNTQHYRSLNPSVGRSIRPQRYCDPASLVSIITVPVCLLGNHASCSGSLQLTPGSTTSML